MKKHCGNCAYGLIDDYEKCEECFEQVGEDTHFTAKNFTEKTCDNCKHKTVKGYSIDGEVLVSFLESKGAKCDNCFDGIKDEWELADEQRI